MQLHTPQRSRICASRICANISKLCFINFSHGTLYKCLGVYLLSKSTTHERTSFWAIFCCSGFLQIHGCCIDVPFLHQWKSKLTTCSSMFYFVNICIGLVSLVIYSVVARRYKYRKRDNICNIHKFAEDYYSKYGSV